MSNISSNFSRITSHFSVSALELHALIVHQVNHLAGEDAFTKGLRNEQFQLGDNAKQFFKSHIVNSINHESASSAQFDEHTSGNDKTIQRLAEEILLDEHMLIENSKVLARRLFDAQFPKKKNVSPGDLVICMFSELATPDLRWLALLKMESSNAFVIRDIQVNGRTVPSIDEVKEVLPSAQLQKCAFVLPPQLAVKNGIDLIVLDQQQLAYGDGKQVATFFLTGFLKCKRRPTQIEKTKLFHDSINSVANRLPLHEAQVVREMGRQAEQSKAINVEDFAQSIVQLGGSAQTSPIAEELVQKFQNGLPEEERTTPAVFSPRGQSRKKRIIRGDYGLKIEFDLDDNLPQDFFKTAEENDNSITITIRTSRTNYWEN